MASILVALPVVVAGTSVVILISWLAGRGVWRAWTFLARYHHDGGFSGYIKTRPLLREALRSARKPVTTFEAALIQTEIDILIPPEDKPRRFDYAEGDYKKRLGEWVESEFKRHLHRKDIFDNLIKWKGLEKERLLASRAKRRTLAMGTPERERPIIEVNNPAVIDNNRNKITRYFVVAKSLPGFQHDFQSFVKMSDGFFAPLFLVAGLMSRFDEDWSPVINNYRGQLKDATKHTSRELVELQSFEFNCWLLWGPSIPLCNCAYWRTDAGATNPSIDSLFYQYGFGDENNSIDVLVENGRSAHFRNFVEEWLIQPHAVDGDASSEAPRIVAATPRSLLGKINYGPVIDEARVCRAQSAIRDEKASRLYLDLDENQIRPGPAGSQYYSAYIWVMFVVCGRDGEPIYNGAKERWRNLLPFFEHGNIADAATMQSLKENLAAKTVSALKEIFTRPSDSERGIRIRYACAFDDSNCSDREGVLFPHGEKTPASTRTPPPLNAERKPRPARIISLLEEMANWDLILGRAITDGRLILSDGHLSSGASWLRDAYSSCHLPEVIDAFFKAVESSEATEDNQAPQLEGN